MRKKDTSVRNVVVRHWHWLIVVGVMAAIVGIYYGLSVLAWREVDAVAARAEGASGRSLATLQAGNLTPQKLDELGQEAESIAKESCNPGVLAHWQSAVVSHYDEKVTNCTQKKERLSRQVRVIQEIAKYTHGEQFITEVLRDTGVKLKTVSTQAYVDRQKVWQKAIDLLQSKRAANEKLYTVVIERIKSIISALATLDAANKAMDVQKFDMARQDLRRAYGALTGIQNISVEQFQTQVDTLVKAYL